jgi:2-polyprenyl-3-methyl-5-hydroxy-6-metoxy-1,4-benzoquinol methylase
METLSKCPVCESERIRFHYAAPTTRRSDSRMWRVDRCDVCSHGFMNPQPSWEDLSAYYSALYDPYDPTHGADGSDDEVVAKATREGRFRHIAIGKDARILDVGCGAGFFLRIATRLGAIGQGVEPSAVAAERARAAGLSVFTGTLEDFVATRPSDRFDVITANHVLEHVPDPVATLSLMKELLAENGMIWIAVPNADCHFNRVLKGWWNSTDLPYHLMQFGTESLTLAGKRAGLEVRSLATYSLPVATAASIRQVLRARYLIPMRLLLRIKLLESYVAPRVAARLDSNGRGEAILIEFRKPVTPAPAPA